jgi:uncharacterized membrane protein YedE/YeeE
VSTPRILVALGAGAVFGLGLAMGGMLDPAVVRGFLDFAGDFDPRLGFVFAGAVAVSAAGVALARQRERPALGATFALPQKARIDAPLIGGSALFGLGWGMVGLCPGPAISGLALGVPEIAIFAAFMLAGMAAHDLTIGTVGASPDGAPVRG